MASYRIVRKSGSFNQYGPAPDVVLSTHRTESAALKAFDRVLGRAVLIAPNGQIINHRIV